MSGRCDFPRYTTLYYIIAFLHYLLHTTIQIYIFIQTSDFHFLTKEQLTLCLYALLYLSLLCFMYPVRLTCAVRPKIASVFIVEAKEHIAPFCCRASMRISGIFALFQSRAILSTPRERILIRATPTNYCVSCLVSRVPRWRRCYTCRTIHSRQMPPVSVFGLFYLALQETVVSKNKKVDSSQCN